MKRLFTFFMMTLFFATTTFASSPTLWPADALSIAHDDKIKLSAIAELQAYANRALAADINAIPTLASAGKTDLADRALQASRLAMKDADNAAVLALMFRLTGEKRYFDKTKNILLAWAKTYHPSGNPIDETRLEGLLWAYDLTSEKFTNEDKVLIDTWLKQLREKKREWHFGPLTTNNNHRIHQLKMLLMLDKILKDDAAVNHDLSEIKKYLSINLHDNGESLDYQERHALHYHNYVLQPWLTIELITHQNAEPINKAFNFLINKIRHHDTGNEFVGSKAPIDSKRGKAGFAYAKTGTNFDVSKAAPTILAYYTIRCESTPLDLQQLIDADKPSPWLAFLKARKVLWQMRECKLEQKHRLI